MQSMCISVVYCIKKVIPVGVKTLPAGVPRSVLVVMECPSFVVVKCLSKVTPVGVIVSLCVVMECLCNLCVLWWSTV